MVLCWWLLNDAVEVVGALGAMDAIIVVFVTGSVVVMLARLSNLPFVVFVIFGGVHLKESDHQSYESIHCFSEPMIKHIELCAFKFYYAYVL